MIILQEHQEVCGSIIKIIQMIADSESFKFNARITGRSPTAGNIKDVEIAVPLK